MVFFAFVIFPSRYDLLIVNKYDLPVSCLKFSTVKEPTNKRDGYYL